MNQLEKDTAWLKEQHKVLDTKVAKLFELAYKNAKIQTNEYTLFHIDLTISDYCISLRISANDNNEQVELVDYWHLNSLVVCFSQLDRELTERNFNEAFASIDKMIKVAEKYYKLNLEHAKNS